MVDISAKADTAREAVARGSVYMKPKTLELIVSGGSDEDLKAHILLALRTKPDAHHLWDGNRPRWRKMIQIGG